MLQPKLTNLRPEFKQIKSELNPYLKRLGEPHIDSFNSMLKYGILKGVEHIPPVTFQTPAGETLSLYISNIHITNPTLPQSCIGKDRDIYPIECRQRSATYNADCSIDMGWDLDGLKKSPINVSMGRIPIMLKSSACNLNNLTPEEMITKGEQEQEWGGYFIIKGNEKLIRMLLMTRRNYPIAIKRKTWVNRGNNFSELGIMVRTVRQTDELSVMNVLHYLNNGEAKFMFPQMKFMAYIPVCYLLKSLMDYSDEVIFEKLIQGYESDKFYQKAIKNMLIEVHNNGFHSKSECENYMGSLFRTKFQNLPDNCSDSDVVDFIFKERILIHLDNNEDKFNFIVLMLQKLFQCVQQQNKIENVDSVMMQEVLLAGHLYQKFLLDRLDLWLTYCKMTILKKCSDSSIAIDTSIVTKAAKHCGGLERALETFLATGNAPSRTGLGLMQNTGLVIMAENINRMRYMSHFRAIHRGSFFTQMRTTEARQLLPDAWGFICPVHTPDGTPCGLLNHLTVNCRVTNLPDEKLVLEIPNVLIKLGMIPLNSPIYNSSFKLYVVMLEGKVLGWIRRSRANTICKKLRYMKVENQLPNMMEIVLIPYKNKGQFPGLFLFVGPTRMMRPVKNLLFNKIEYIGTFEQVYMDIAIDSKEIYPDCTTHMELSKTDFLSNLALLIPMPDCNQSPRNMYQCQMGKQTMGTPLHNWPFQAGNKIYRLQTPATPLFRPVHYDNVNLDDYAMGTNAIIAIISYTGYDMEDAMIINKAAHDRGFAYGSIYKTKFIELPGTSYFARDPHNRTLEDFIDNDGLPRPGAHLEYKDPFYCYYNTDTCIYMVVKNDEKENAVIDNIKLCGSFKLNGPKCVSITLRIPRPSTVGDKFASRAGQKGILSQKFPTEDLPFTESGLIPDVVFNPHGFPSRMTIAMMIETMAGKSAALHGLVHDATPFRFSEENTAINYFGELLKRGGYNYYGSERLYSGVDGREMTADIFFGVVHYQRLRHMVLDKWQVRSTGPVDAVTMQPIKGRKRGGGVRFGEMERDSLISHGASYLLHDRLFSCSDRISTLICKQCGSLLAPMPAITKKLDYGVDSKPMTCRFCKDGSKIGYIEIPHSFKYLVTELSSVNINARLKLISI